MKKKWLCHFIIASLVSLAAPAQKKSSQFHSINQGGIVVGESEVNGAFQTVNGIQFSNWFAAAGIGVDYYRYRSMPLFFDARRHLGKEKEGFVYADLGYNFPLENKPGKEIDYYNSYYFTGGFYTDLGIGFRVPLHKKSFFLFSFGYTNKRMAIKTLSDICGIIGPCWVDYSKYEYNLNRVMLKAGLGF